MKGGGVKELEDLPQEEEEEGAVELSPEVLGVVVCSVWLLLSDPPNPKFGRNFRTAKNTAMTMSRVMSNRENVVSLGIVCFCLPAIARLGRRRVDLR